MKTAISLPDALFHSAEALAHRLGVSRSKLFANAVAEFIAQLYNQKCSRVFEHVYENYPEHNVGVYATG